MAFSDCMEDKFLIKTSKNGIDEEMELETLSFAPLSNLPSTRELEDKHPVQNQTNERKVAYLYSFRLNCSTSVSSSDAIQAAERKRGERHKLQTHCL